MSPSASVDDAVNPPRPGFQPLNWQRWRSGQRFISPGSGRVPTLPESGSRPANPILEACAEGYGFARGQKSCQNYQGWLGIRRAFFGRNGYAFGAPHCMKIAWCGPKSFIFNTSSGESTSGRFGQKSSGMYSIANTHCDWSADEPTTRNSYFLPFNLNFIKSLSRVN